LDYIINGFKSAIILIISFDRNFLRICWTSIWISGTSVLLACAVSLPAAFAIASHSFKGKKTLVTILNTLMAVPTVVVGLLVYSFLCRKGPFGRLALLYTPQAMMIGQFILVTPIITALIASSLSRADDRIQKTTFTLGATKLQSWLTLGKEMRIAIVASIMAGFGRVFSEIGISMMLGGNIKNYTRNITTTIAFETAKGEFSLAIALGIILLAFALTVNILFQVFIREKHGAL